jgi:anti-sigma factor RsiW
VSRCASRVAFETLVAYWAGDLPATDEAALEEHLMGCATCAGESGRVAEITEALRAMIPPILTRPMVDALRAKGRDVREDSFAPGERREVQLPPDFDLFVFHLGGIDLTRAARVELRVSDEASGEPLTVVDAAPFDAGAGEVLLCCQPHYASLPPDIVAAVHVHDQDGAERAFRYTILHRFAPG